MDEINVLKQFLDFPIGSTEEIFSQFKTLDGYVFRENKTYRKERFLYIEGKRKNKILLIAHADTVYDSFYKKKTFSQTIVEENNILKALSENGKFQALGADDRVGLAMLWLLKDSGHSLLVTDGEEGARIGSKWLKMENRDIAERINQNHQFMIQLDRCNGSEFKCYHVGNDEFRAFIKEQTGFSEPEFGAQTDVCSLCEDICGTNLSIGYYDNHTEYESLNIKEWLHTLQIVRKILAKENLPKFHLPRISCFRRIRYSLTQFFGI